MAGSALSGVADCASAIAAHAAIIETPKRADVTCTEFPLPRVSAEGRSRFSLVACRGGDGFSWGLARGRLGAGLDQARGRPGTRPGAGLDLPQATPRN